MVPSSLLLYLPSEGSTFLYSVQQVEEKTEKVSLSAFKKTFYKYYLLFWFIILVRTLSHGHNELQGKPKNTVLYLAP